MVSGTVRARCRGDAWRRSTRRPRPPDAHRRLTTQLALEGLDLEELFEAEAAELASVTGLLVPTKRSHRVEAAAVDLDLTGAHPLRERERLLLIACPHRTGEAVVRVVRDAQRVVLVVVRDDRQDRTEDLLLRDGHVRRHVGEDRGPHVVPVVETFRGLRTAGHHAGAFGHAL